MLGMKISKCSVTVLAQLNPTERDLIFIPSKPQVMAITKSGYSGDGATSHLSSVEIV